MIDTTNLFNHPLHNPSHHLFIGVFVNICVCFVVTTSADGYLLPPLIMPGKRHMRDWYEKNQAKLPPQYIVQTTENGYTNDEIGYHWIHHSHAFTKDRTTGT